MDPPPTRALGLNPNALSVGAEVELPPLALRPGLQSPSKHLLPISPVCTPFKGEGTALPHPPMAEWERIQGGVKLPSAFVIRGDNPCGCRVFVPDRDTTMAGFGILNKPCPCQG